MLQNFPIEFEVLFTDRLFFFYFFTEILSNAHLLCRCWLNLTIHMFVMELPWLWVLLALELA